MLYTVGHSTLLPHDFINILKNYGIVVLLDVRGIPYSKYAPQFNKETLQEFCTMSSITYYHVPILSHKNISKYHKPSEKILKYLQRIVDISLEQNVAIMGPTWNYDKCHRKQITDWILEFSDTKINHINVQDNTVVTENHKISQTSFFDDL
jgi:uncharacterized protein (DUF488 family)